MAIFRILGATPKKVGEGEVTKILDLFLNPKNEEEAHAKRIK